MNVVNRDGDTPLSESADRLHVECVKLLTESGADVNRRNRRGETPFLRAVLRQNFMSYSVPTVCANECVRFLLEAGADVNMASNSGYTALIAAASKGKYERVRIMFTANALLFNAKLYTKLS